jgi:hypothetical protein
MEKRLLNSIIDTLSFFQPITLKEMDGVSLMNRTDTKFVFEASLLPEILKEANTFYKILEISNRRYADYKTDYFDSLDYRLYNNHHNSKLNRYKIRYREYIGSDLSFLEVKFKNNKGKTLKSRINSWVNSKNISDSDNDFLREKTPYDREKLMHILTNNFSRITLVSKTDKERLTIDFSLQFLKEGKLKQLGNLAIAEVKQENVNRDSEIMSILKNNQIREASFSKYATGAALLNPDLKYNKFKKNFLYLNKIHKNGDIWNTVV